MSTNPIKKIAFFVEGATELKFIEKLLQEVLTKNKYTIQTQEMRGKKTFVSINVLEKGAVLSTTQCFILITDCGSDSTVKSYILEQKDSLIKSGYSIIIGLLDLFPKKKTDYNAFKYGLYYKVPQVPIPIQFVISVMEIEAWFIAEYNHFQKIDSRLTTSFINTKIGVDLTSTVFEDIANPAATLNSIYGLARMGYSKRASQVQNTVNSLDYAELYYSVSTKVPNLKELIDLIDCYIIS